MLTPLIAWLATALFFLGPDSVWLTLTAGSLYRPALGDLMAERPDFIAAGVFYAIYVTGLVVLVVYPALQSGGWRQAARVGAIFGFVAYATYDLTNQATLRGWPLHLTLADMAWGTVLSGFGSAAATMVTAWLTRNA